MSHITLILENYLKRTNPFVRFLFVGIVNTLISLAIILLLINGFGQGYWMSTLIGNGVGMMNSFFLNRSITFRSNVSLWRGGLSFFVVSIGCYLGAYTFSEQLAERYFSTIQVEQLFSAKEVAVLLGMILYTVSSYIGQKHLVFNKRI